VEPLDPEMLSVRLQWMALLPVGFARQMKWQTKLSG
jgi:hypothetical protein